MPHRKTAAVLFLLVSVLGACTGETLDGLAEETSHDASADAVEVDRVEMHNDEFVPAAVEVPAGTTVTWEFTDDGRAHNVVGDGFESEVTGEGVFTHTFTEPGVHHYECTLHRGMDGRVVVTE